MKHFWERLSLRKRRPSGGETDRQTLLENLPKYTVGAEIGVWKGDFSQRLLDVVQPRELHLIDPWKFQEEYPTRMYGGKVAKGQSDMDALHQSVVRRFTDPAVKIHRGSSQEILATFPSEYFDWIYIDGNHSFEFVLEDLNLAARVVRRGGYICGDDYTWTSGEDVPVRRAVSAFLKTASVTPMRIDSQFVLWLE